MDKKNRKSLPLVVILSLNCYSIYYEPDYVISLLNFGGQLVATVQIGPYSEVTSYGNNLYVGTFFFTEQLWHYILNFWTQDNIKTY